MTDTPTHTPATVTAGDTIEFKRSFPDYLPADGWTLTYALVKSGVDRIEWTASDAGDGTHLVTITAGDTAAYNPGDYRLQGYVTKGSERHTVERGSITIKADFASQASGYDARSHVEKTLAAIEAVIEGRATKDQETYSIAGRSLSRTPIADLITLRDRYKSELKALQRAERVAKGLDPGGRVLTRFSC